MLSTELSGKAAAVTHATPGVRYIGAMRTRDDTDVSQRVDLTVKGKFDALDARASVATNDTSWAWNWPFDRRVVRSCARQREAR